MEEMNKLVTIIIPAFNVEKYIGRCLESVLAQSYSHLEIIVIDDGSSDNTWQVVSSYADRDDRIKAFHRNNSGVSASRNFAIDQSSGHYIQFVDADDYIRSDAVEIMVKALESSGASWVNCQYNRLDEADNKLEEYSFINGFIVTDTKDKRFRFIRDELCDYRVGYEVWNKLFIASIIKENSLTFSEDCRIGEDLAFNICYGFFADSINCIDDRIYNYLIRSDSAMGTVGSLEKNIEEHLLLCKAVEKQLDKAQMSAYKDCFYQLFYKLLIHASCGYTARETVEVVKNLNDSYYIDNMQEALTHKNELIELVRPEVSKLYYKYVLYVVSDIKHNKFQKLYLKLFDIYRVLRRRPTIEEWRIF